MNPNNLTGYWDIESGAELTDGDFERRYNDFLDEVYGDVQIAGLTYSTSRALYELDPTAYRCGLNDWLDSELGETLTDVPPNSDRPA